MNEVDAIRLDQFRQLKKEIRGSEEHMIVGIDVAKDKHHAFFGTVRGETLLRRLVFENNIQGFEKLMSHVQTLKACHGLSKVVFGVEPTANYHKPLGEHLIKCGCMLVLVAGEVIKKNRVLLDGRWDSHDTKDAANVADLIGQGNFQFYEYPPMPLRDLRNLLSWKRRLKKQEHGLKVPVSPISIYGGEGLNPFKRMVLNVGEPITITSCIESSTIGNPINNFTQCLEKKIADLLIESGLQNISNS